MKKIIERIGQVALIALMAVGVAYSIFLGKKPPKEEPNVRLECSKSGDKSCTLFVSLPKELSHVSDLKAFSAVTYIDLHNAPSHTIVTLAYRDPNKASEGSYTWMHIQLHRWEDISSVALESTPSSGVILKTAPIHYL